MNPTIFSFEDALTSDSNIMIMPSLLREAMDMIFESHDYFDLQSEIDQSTVPSHVRTMMANEMSRITMRLTSVMAWLMARKAVIGGEMELDEAITNYRLEGEEYCLARHEEYYPLLPDFIVSLLERSLTLYERVWRLDQDHHDQLSFQIS